MAHPPSVTSAASWLGLDPAAFEQLVGHGVFRHRASDDATYWPEEIAAAALGDHPLAALLPPVAALLAFARIAADAPPRDEIARAAVRLSLLLSAADGGAYYRRCSPTRYELVVRVGDAVAMPPTIAVESGAVSAPVVEVPGRQTLTFSVRDTPGTPKSEVLGLLVVAWDRSAPGGRDQPAERGPLRGLADILGLIEAQADVADIPAEVTLLARLADTDRMWDASGRPDPAALAVLAQRLTGSTAAALYRVAAPATPRHGMLAPLVRTATHGAETGRFPTLSMLPSADLKTLLAGGTVVVPDLDHARWILLKPDANACLVGAAEVDAHGDTVGVFLVSDRGAGTLGQDGADLLASLGRVSGSCFAPGRAEDRDTAASGGVNLQSTSTQTLLLDDADGALSRTTRLPVVLHSLTTRSALATSADAAGIYLYGEDGIGIRIAARWNRQGTARNAPFGEDDRWTLYDLTPLGFDVTDHRREQAQREFSRAIALTGRAAVAVLPLVFEDEVIGCSWLARSPERPAFSAHELGLFSEFGQNSTVAIERALLVDGEQRQRHEASILLRLAAAMNETESLDDLMAMVAQAAGEAVGADRVSVYVYNETYTRTVGAAHYTGPGGARPAPERLAALDPLSPIEIPAEAEVIRTRKPLRRDAETLFPDPFPVDGWRTDILVPLLAENTVQGVFYARETARSRLFGPEDLALLRAIGQHAGFAVVRARDADAATRRAEYLTTLNHLGHALSGTVDIDKLCEQLKIHIQRMLPMDAFAVALIDDSTDELHFVYADPNGVTTGLNGASPAASTPATLFVPMLRDERVVGVLSVQRRDGLEYDAEDERTLETVAQQAAAAFAWARLFAQSAADRVTAESHAADFQAVLAVSHAVASAPDLAKMLDVLAEELESLIPHHECCVFNFTADRSRLSAILYRRDGTPFDLSDPTHPASDGLCGFAVRTGQAALVNNAHLDERSVYYPSQFDLKHTTGEHVLVAPLSVAGEILGVILMNRFGDDAPFSEAEFTIFRVLAEQASAALRNATLVAEAVVARERSAKHAANLEAVLATTRAVTAQIDLPLTLGALADHLQQLLPHDRLTLWRRDDRDGAYRPLIARAAGKPWSLSGEIPATDELFSHLSEARTPLVIEPKDGPGQRMLMPLVVTGSAIGVIDLVRLGNCAFSADELTIFQVLAGQAEVAVHASLLFAEERRRQRFASVLVEAAGALNRATTQMEVTRHLAESAAAAVAADRAMLCLYDDDAASTIAWYSLSTDHSSDFADFARMSPRDVPIERRVLATGRPVVGDQLATLLAERPDLNPSQQRGGAAVPLRVGNRIQGVLYIWDSAAAPDKPRHFDHDEMSLLEAICDQAGVAAERSRLHADTERRVVQLRAIEGVNAAVTRTLDLRPMLRETLARVAEALACDLSLVALPEGDPPTLRIAEFGGQSDIEFVGLALPNDSSLNGRVFTTGQPIRGEEGDGHHFYPPPGRANFIRYFLCVPLQIEGRTIGTVQVLRPGPAPFTADDEELLRLIANQLAVGIERARIFGVAVAARARSERQARNLETVLFSSRLLALQTDLASTLEAFCDGLQRVVPYAHACVFRAELDTEELVLLTQRGHGAFDLIGDRLSFDHGLTGRVARRREPLRRSHIEGDPDFNRNAWRRTPAFAAAVAAGIHTIILPLLVEGTLLGVVCVNRVGSGPELGPFTDEEWSVAQVFAGQAAAAIRNADLVARNRDLYLGVVRALAAMVDAKDRYTHGHAERVSLTARRIATEMGLDRESAETVELAALLHDIGKIGVPDRILQRPGPLDEADRVTMMGHAAQGADIVARAGVEVLQPLVPLIRHHHEWLNGNGYPDGLAGDAIPLGAAVIAVADAFDTLVTDRPYRQGRTVADAVAELRRCVGAQFRGDIVEALATLLDIPLAPEIVGVDGRSAAEFAADNLATLAAVGIGAGSDFGAEPGRMGDSRPLAVLVDVAKITRHMPDLRTFLDQLPAIVQHRLGYDDVALYLVEPDSDDLQIAAHSGAVRRFAPGFRVAPHQGVPGDVLATGRTASTGETDAPSTPPVVAAIAPGGSEIGVPLFVEETTIGVLSVASAAAAAFTWSDHLALSAIADQIAMAVHVARLHAAAKHAAATDGLTGLLNHRAFYEALERAATTGAPFAVLLFDVEGLKATNDSRGHLAGDALLRRVAHAIQTLVGTDDVAARYGGDEFGVIMYGEGAESGIAAAASVRAALLGMSLGAGARPTTVRFGVAASPADGTGPYELIAIADARLYEMRASHPVVDVPTQPALIVSDAVIVVEH